MSTSRKARHLAFDVQTAIDYGVNEAIMIQNFVFWIEKNLANNKNHHDGRTWTYNTQEAFTFLFPFWSKWQVQRIIESLEKQGVLIKGNYNHHAYDRTQWYAFSDEDKWLNKFENTPQTLEDVHIAKSQNGNCEIAPSKLQNRKMEIAESQNGNCEIASPIPNNYTNKKTNNNNNTPDPQIAAPVTLPLVGLTEHQKEEAGEKLAQLSPEQRNIAIQSFNKAISTNTVKTPAALMNRLINLGLKNGLEAVKTVEPIPMTQSPKKPVITDKEREATRLEVMKAFVANKKADLLKEFAERGCVSSRALGTIIEPDLRLAGLFD
jgi:hypothetical protein